MELAGQLKSVPALEQYGLSLEGDVNLYQGNKERAFRAYAAAAEIKPSPSIDRRLPLAKSDTGVLKFTPQKERDMAIGTDPGAGKTGDTKGPVTENRDQSRREAMRQ